MILNSTGHAAITTPASAFNPPMPGPNRRTRHFTGRGSMAGLPIVTAAGDVVLVSLFGRRAAGRCMALDADVWAALVARTATRWVVNQNGSGLDYVKSGSGLVLDAADQPGGTPTVTLARLVMGARRGDRVLYSNRNRLDLRRANLSLEFPRLIGAAA